jgi:transcriptional regulator with XRE-family HTH domain
MTMQQKAITRQQRLQVWRIENGKTWAELAEGSGIPPRNLSAYLSGAKTIPLFVRAAALAAGIPAELVPEATRSKAELLAENEALRERVQDLEARLDPGAA